MLVLVACKARIIWWGLACSLIPYILTCENGAGTQTPAGQFSILHTSLVCGFCPEHCESGKISCEEPEDPHITSRVLIPPPQLTEHWRKTNHAHFYLVVCVNVFSVLVETWKYWSVSYSMGRQTFLKQRTSIRCLILQMVRLAGDGSIFRRVKILNGFILKEFLFWRVLFWVFFISKGHYSKDFWPEVSLFRRFEFGRVIIRTIWFLHWKEVSRLDSFSLSPANHIISPTSQTSLPVKQKKSPTYEWM